jgi:hypothetical protein
MGAGKILQKETHMKKVKPAFILFLLIASLQAAVVNRDKPLIGQELIHYVDGEVYIPATNGINLFTKEGVYVQTVKQEGRWLHPRIILNKDEIISAPKTAVFLSDGKGEIIRKNIKTGNETVISGFSLQDWGIAHSGENVVDIVAIGFSPLMILGYAENRLYWGMNTSYMINVTDLSGKKINTFSVKRRGKKVSDKFKKKFFESPNSRNQACTGEPGSRFPAAGRLAFPGSRESFTPG